MPRRTAAWLRGAGMLQLTAGDGLLADAGSAVVPKAPSSPDAIHPSVACAHRYVYVDAVKRPELERRLRSLGWVRLRHGGRHDVWSDGERQEAVPRHAEISERLAAAILDRAKRKV